MYLVVGGMFLIEGVTYWWGEVTVFVGFLYLVGMLSLICSVVFVGFMVGRVLENLVLGFCIMVGTPLKHLILFYLFFADKKKGAKKPHLENI